VGTLKWKIKLSALWVILGLNYVSYHFLSLIGSGEVEKTPIQVSDETIGYIVTIFYLVHCIMIWLSLVLKDSANRLTNIVLGVLFTAIKAFALVYNLLNSGSPSLSFNILWGFVAAALVVWYAWKWPKQEA